MAQVKRSYRSAIRRGDAPGLVCEAARRLFSTRGYLATSIEDIAAEAGVARPTVFTAVGTKPVILKAVFDQAMAGDNAPVPIAGRAWWKEALHEPDPARSIQLHARNMSWITQRAAPLARAIEAAAAVDKDVAELWTQYQRQRRAGLAAFAENLAAKTALRCDLGTAVDTMWALSPDAYWRLVHDAGWPVEKYQAWLTDLLQRLLLE
jgi:TetR/AcrR family transcriptional regulator, regulator of autoinduction and epiphytic fitness